MTKAESKSSRRANFGRRQRVSRKSRLGRTLGVETLEDRRVLSVAQFSADADSGADDHQGLLAQVYHPPGEYFLAPSGFLTSPASGSAASIASNYLSQNEQAFGIPNSSNMVVTDQYVSPHTGVTHIYYQQLYQGLPVRGAEINVNVSRDGQIISAGSSFISSLNDPGPTNHAAPLAPVDAVLEFASDVGATLDRAPRIVQASPGIRKQTIIEADGLSMDDIPVGLHYEPTPDGDVELAWNMQVRTQDGLHWYDASLSAQTGELLFVSDWVDGATYNVVPLPLESPDHGDRALVVDAHDLLASPFGWHDNPGFPGNDFPDTRGNNVFAQADRFFLDLGLGPRPSGGPDAVFDFEFSLGQTPEDYQDAAVTNLFYWNNVIHDIHYQYGFTEEAGNFQLGNYGRGGLGGDHVRADAQLGAEFGVANNAFFATPPDGLQPQMGMFEFDTDFTDFSAISPPRDSDFDTGIIIHEYGHGVSNRLTGGPSDSNALNRQQSGGMGEGWGDWWSLMFTQAGDSLAEDPRYVATHVQAQTPEDGPGIRNWPFSFDMTVNPLTYGRYNAFAWPDAPNPAPFKNNPGNEVHNAGEIWASVLWDLNWLLINGDGDQLPAYGFDGDLYTGNGGNNLALQLVMDGLKMQPANPSFLDGRDAILAADTALTGGQNHLAIWTAFARRGMGFSAEDSIVITPGVLELDFVTEAFDAPPSLVGTSSAVGTLSVEGIVFDDDNANGVREPAEDPLAGWTVFLDGNRNGRRDLGERFVETGDDGRYLLRAVAQGTSIDIELMEDYQQTFPSNSGNHTVPSSGQNASNLDFGVRLHRGTISGRKWNDLDRDGQQDPDEPGVRDVYIYADVNLNGRADLNEPAARTGRNGRYTITLGPGTYTIREGVFESVEQTFPGGVGTYVVTLGPNDKLTGFDFGNFFPPNNDPPVATPNRYTTDEDTPVAGNLITDNTSSGVDSDPEGDPISVSAVNGIGANVGSPFLLPSGATLTVSTTGSFTYDPTTSSVLNALAAGGMTTDTYTYTISDGVIGTSTATVTMTIGGLNDAPSIADQTITIDIDEIVDGGLAGTVAASDPDAGDTLTFAILSGDPGGVFALNPTTGDLTVPDADVLVPETQFSLVVQVTDSASPALSNMATVTVNVVTTAERVVLSLDTFANSGAEIPDGGTVSVGDTFSLDVFVQDTQSVGIFAAYLDILYNASLVTVVVGETQTLTLPANTTGGTFTMTFDGQTTGAIAYDLRIDRTVQNIITALEPLIGADNFRVTQMPLEDSNGSLVNPNIFDIRFRRDRAEMDVPNMTADGSNLTTSSGSGAAATVVETHPADINDDGAFVSSIEFGPSYANAQSALNGLNVLDEVGAADGDPSDPNAPLGGGPFLLFSVPLRATDTGTVTFQADPADEFPIHHVLPFFSEDPIPTDTILYESTSLTILPGAANNPPVATDNSYSTDEDTAVQGNVITDDTSSGVDFDLDGDLLSVKAVNGLTGNVGIPLTLSSGATLMVGQNGTFTYNPQGAFDSLADNETTSDTFTYSITDGSDDSTPATVTIDLTGINDPPTVNDQTFAVDEDATNGTVVGTVAASDPEMDSLAFEITAGDPDSVFEIGPSTGQITVADSNGLNPDTSFALTVEVTDSGTPALSDTATITILVQAVGESRVVFRFEATDMAGNEITSLTEGDRFQLHGFVTDTLVPADGVFAAYTDIRVANASLISVVPSETQTLTLSANANGGSFTLSLDAAEATIAFDARINRLIANLQAGLDQILGAGNSEVIQVPLLDQDGNLINNNIFDIRFVGDLAEMDIDLLMADPSNLTTTNGAAMAEVVESHPADISDPGTYRASFSAGQCDPDFGQFTPCYPNGRSAVDEPGELGAPGTERQFGEVGGFDGQDPLGGGEFLLFTVTLDADAAGTVTFTGAPADDTGHDVLVFRSDNPVPSNLIDYGDPVSVVIAAPGGPLFTNVINPMDVNNDGFLTPLDALIVINDLNMHGSRNLPPARRSADAPAAIIAMPSSFVDVNRDNAVSPIDALMVINALNQPAAPVSRPAVQAAVHSAPAQPLAESPLLAESPQVAFEVSGYAAVAINLSGSRTVTIDASHATVVRPVDAVTTDRDPAASIDVSSATAGSVGSEDGVADKLVVGDEDWMPSAMDLDQVLTELAEDVAGAWQDEENLQPQ